MSNSILEISVILIIIVVIFGIMLSSVENSTEKVIKSQENNHLEKLVTEFCDNLINNPGVPENWNENNKGTPGLAVVNDGGQIVPNSVSYVKLIALGEDYNKLVSEKYFNSKIKTSVELLPQESSISSVKIGDDDEGNTVFSINRLVKCDFYKNYVIKDFKNDGKCNKQHDQGSYSCNYFKVFPKNLRNSDYYLLVDDGEKYDLNYIVDTTRVVKERYWQTAISNKIYLNNMIDFYDDASAVVFIHLDKKDPDALLVSVPKNFDSDYLDYDYFKTCECRFIVNAWY